MCRLSNPAIPLVGVHPQKLIFEDTKIQLYGDHCSTVHNSKSSETPTLFSTQPQVRHRECVVIKANFKKFCNVESSFGIYLETLYTQSLLFSDSQFRQKFLPMQPGCFYRRHVNVIKIKSRKLDMKWLIMIILENGTQNDLCIV